MNFGPHSVKDLLEFAYSVAQKSPERTQNGAIVWHSDNTWSLGYNVNLNPKNTGYDFVVHAEEDAILNFPVKPKISDAVLISPWASCASCARKMVRVGIKTLVRHGARTCKKFSNDWWSTICEADDFMRNNGVEIINVDGPISGLSVKIRDRLWSPKTMEYVS